MFCFSYPQFLSQRCGQRPTTIKQTYHFKMVAVVRISTTTTTVQIYKMVIQGVLLTTDTKLMRYVISLEEILTEF